MSSTTDLSREDYALIAVRKDGFVDGASYSDQANAELIRIAKENGFSVRKVSKAVAKAVLYENISECTFEA